MDRYPDADDPYLTVRQVAAELNMPRGGVYRLINSGALKATRLSERRTRIRRSDLDRMLRSTGAEPAAKEREPEMLAYRHLSLGFSADER